MRNRTRIPGVLATCLLASACVGEDSVLFVTTTNIGIDADTTPPNLAIAYDRYEGYFGPTYASGALPPVYARLQSNNSVFNPKIKQTYATGEAARLISSDEKCPKCTPSDTPPELTGDKRVAFAGTTATVGLKVTFSPQGPPESVALGYKRKEYSLIPVLSQEVVLKNGEKDKKDTYASVVAAFGINAATTKVADAGLGVSQFFATGVAAQNLARDSGIREIFKGEAEEALALIDYGADNNSDLLREKTKEDASYEKLQKWVSDQHDKNCPGIPELLNNKYCAQLRKQALSVVP